MSIRRIAREFGITHTQVIRVLRDTGGDPLIADASVADLERERDRLRDRIAADRRRLRVVLEELGARQTDAILGV